MKDRSTLGCERLSAKTKAAKTKVALGARFNLLMRLSRTNLLMRLSRTNLLMRLSRTNLLMRLSRTLTRDGQRQGRGMNLSPSPLSRR